MVKPIVIAAGGTGGHFFPAEALAGELVARGHRIALMTDARSCGLVTSFGLQSFVNMASTLHLIPTKGMTLPFVSYGGSSVLAVALGMGMLLALTRRRPRAENWEAARCEVKPSAPSSSPPAAPAGTSSQPRRSPASWSAAATGSR